MICAILRMPLIVRYFSGDIKTDNTPASIQAALDQLSVECDVMIQASASGKVCDIKLDGHSPGHHYVKAICDGFGLEMMEVLFVGEYTPEKVAEIRLVCDVKNVVVTPMHDIEPEDWAC